MSNFFKSQKEIYEHLIKGGMVRSYNMTVRMNDDGMTETKRDGSPWGLENHYFCDYKQWQPYTEPEKPKKACAFVITRDGSITFAIEDGEEFKRLSLSNSFARSPQYDIEPKDEK